MKNGYTSWEIAKFRAMVANNPEAFKDNDEDECDNDSKGGPYREAYEDDSKPVITKLTIKEPTTWQIFCSWLYNLFN